MQFCGAGSIVTADGSAGVLEEPFEQATALRQAAKRSLERLDKTEKETYPSESITDYYTILQRLLEAMAADEGIRFSGDGAHRDLIDYYAADEEERALLQRLRECRNRVLYEGFVFLS